VRAMLVLALCLSSIARAQDAPPVEEVAAPAQWGRGPLEARDPFILALARLSPWARSPELLAHKQVEVGLRGLWSNSYGFTAGRYVLDAEVRQLHVVPRVGLFDRLELGLDLPYEWRGGGVMDGFIEGFHDAFGIPEMDRDRRKRDRYLVAGLERDGSLFQLEHKGYGFSDLIVEARGLLTEGSDLHPAIAATLRLRLPTGRQKFELSHGVDPSLALDLSKRLGRLPLIVYSTLAYTYHADARVDDLELMRHRFFASLGVEWEITPIVSIVTHAWVETKRERSLFADPARPPIPDADLPYGNYITYIAAGFKLEPLPGLRVEVGMLEDLVDPETTADFTLLGNVAYRF
jgi:hypothetical protein